MSLRQRESASWALVNSRQRQQSAQGQEPPCSGLRAHITTCGAGRAVPGRVLALPILGHQPPCSGLLCPQLMRQLPGLQGTLPPIVRAWGDRSVPPFGPQSGHPAFLARGRAKASEPLALTARTGGRAESCPGLGANRPARPDRGGGGGAAAWPSVGGLTGGGVYTDTGCDCDVCRPSWA